MSPADQSESYLVVDPTLVLAGAEIDESIDQEVPLYSIHTVKGLTRMPGTPVGC